jgi:hypothetical protein
MATYKVQFLDWEKTDGPALDKGEGFMDQVGEWQVTGRYTKEVFVNLLGHADSSPEACELVWSQLQRIDNKNPILDEHGLRSMSVGDMIYCPNGFTMVARSVGFERL